VAVCWDMRCVWRGTPLLLNVDDCKIMRDACYCATEMTRRATKRWELLELAIPTLTTYILDVFTSPLPANTSMNPRHFALFSFSLSLVREQNSHTGASTQTQTAQPDLRDARLGPILRRCSICWACTKLSRTATSSIQSMHTH
jgi:hypothetical protein